MGRRFHGFPKDHNSSFTQISEIKSIYTRTILEAYIGGHLFLLSSWPIENSGRQSRGFLGLLGFVFSFIHIHVLSKMKENWQKPSVNYCIETRKHVL